MVVVDILVFVAVGLYLSRIGLGSGRDGAAAVGHTRHYAHVCGSVAYLDVGCAAGISSFCTRWADVVVDPCQRTDREVDARQFAGA